MSYERLTEHCGLKITPLERITHLDGAAMAPLPDVSLGRIQHYHQEFQRSGYSKEFVRHAYDSLSLVRNEIQRLIGALSSNDIVLTRSAKEAINIVANGINWSEGDEILVSSQEHVSNILPWLNVAQRFGCKVRIFRSQPGEQFEVSSIEAATTDRTRLVAITHLSHVHGTLQPVEEIVRVLKPRGIYTLVDAAQSVGRIAFEVTDIGCDFLAATGRKALLGPMGSGFLYVAPSVTELIPLLCTPSSAEFDADRLQISYRPLPHRLEGILPPPENLFALEESIRWINAVGLDRVQNHIQCLTKSVFEVLGSFEDIRILTPERTKTGIVSWWVENGDSMRVASQLANCGVYIGYGRFGYPFLEAHIKRPGICRVSVSSYNSLTDILNLQDVLKTILT